MFEGRSPQNTGNPPGDSTRRMSVLGAVSVQSGCAERLGVYRRSPARGRPTDQAAAVACTAVGGREGWRGEKGRGRKGEEEAEREGDVPSQPAHLTLPDLLSFSHCQSAHGSELKPCTDISSPPLSCFTPVCKILQRPPLTCPCEGLTAAFFVTSI